MTLNACLNIEETQNACLLCNEEVSKHLRHLSEEFNVALDSFVREIPPSEEVCASSKIVFRHVNVERFFCTSQLGGL